MSKNKDREYELKIEIRDCGLEKVDWRLNKLDIKYNT